VYIQNEKMKFEINKTRYINVTGSEHKFERQIGNLAGMEGSESEAVFDTLNLNPQLFCNEVLNNVDDVLDEAFRFFYQ